MSIDLSYVPLFTIEEVILDKDTGLPLAAGVVSFYRDSQRATPKSVFQISGSSPNYTFTDIGTVLTLGLSGTFVDGNGDPMVPYAFPYDADGNVDLYYVTVESSGAVDQFTREAVPYLAGTNIPSSQRSSTENELSNPQFVDVLFPVSGTTTINVTGSNTVTSIAPNWDIISSGTGTLTLEILQPTASAVPTNPPYALSITASAGLGSQVTLRQRLTNTPSIMRGGFASGSLTAAVISGGGSNVSMTYAPSTGSSTTIIPSTSITADGSYHTISNNAAIPQQVNTAADTGYIDVLITIPTSRTIAITSIQLVGTEISANIPFDEQTVARQVDHLFHYYKPELAFKQIPSALIGWDFPLNPAQPFGGKTVASQAVGANKSYYAWDQTIIFQSADNSVAISADGFGGLAIAPNTTTQVAIIQYLDAQQAAKLINQKLCVNVYGACDISSSATCPFTVTLWRTTDASLPALPDSLVATMDSNGKPATFNGSWSEIPRLNNQDARGILEIGGQFLDFPFSGWDLADNFSAQVTTYFAIVVGTPSMVSGQIMHIESISLQAGDIPTRPAPQTTDEVLRECEYYYEKSYENNVAPGASGASAKLSQLTAQMQQRFDAGAGSQWQSYALPFGFEFRTVKRVNPNLALYSANTGAISKVWINQYKNGGTPAEVDATVATFWTLANLGTKAVDYAAVNQTSNGFFSGGGIPTGGATDFVNTTLYFQYVADARLGVV